MDNFYDLPEDIQYAELLQQELEYGDFEADDGQPTEYEEWQDYMGGDGDQ